MHGNVQIVVMNDNFLILILVIKVWQPLQQQPARCWRVAELSLDHLPDRAQGLDVRPGDILSPLLSHCSWFEPHRDNQQLPHPVHIRPGRGLQRQVGPREPSRRGVLQVRSNEVQSIDPSIDVCRTMFDNECNILSNLAKHDYQQVRTMLIETVLGTGEDKICILRCIIWNIYFSRHVTSFHPVAIHPVCYYQ